MTPEELHFAKHPLTWRNIFRRIQPLTALQIAVASLEHAQRQRLHHANLAEEHESQRAMYAKREKRLRDEIAELSRSEEEKHDSDH